MPENTARRSSRLRIGVFLAASILVLAAHAVFVRTKVHEPSQEVYRRTGIDLRVKGGWKYGYLAGMHGAVLARVPIGTPEPERQSRQQPELSAAMRRELDLLPAKIVGESFLYIGLLAWTFFGANGMRSRLGFLERSRAGRVTRFLLPGAILYALLAAPLLLYGYGYGGFTNLAGPGAMSYSGPYYDWTLWRLNSGNTVSYRAFVSLAVLPVGMTEGLSGYALRAIPLFGEEIEESLRLVSYWVFGALLYGAAFGSLLLVRLNRPRREDETSSPVPSTET